MKNILKENPDVPLHGRALWNTRYVDESSLEGKKVLDLGCGYGWFEKFALKNGVRSIVGVDISEHHIQIAEDYFNDDRIKFRNGSALDIPVEDGVFDTVVSWEVIEHIPKNTEPQMFSEVSRVLKKGGLFYLSTQYDSLGKFLDPAWWLAGHRHYSKEYLKNLAEDTGFEVVDVKIYGGLWELIHVLNMYTSKWVFRRPPLFSSFVNRKRDDTYEDGRLTNIFMKCKKL